MEMESQSSAAEGGIPAEGVSDRPAPPPRRQPTRRRGAQACVICNKRKIRCKLPPDGGPCDNCRSFDYECIPHQRKRKRYSVVSSDDSFAREKHIVVATSERPKSTTTTRNNVDNTPRARVPGLPVPVTRSPQVQTPQETVEFVQAALTAQFGHHGYDASLASYRNSSAHGPTRGSMDRNQTGVESSPGGQSTSAYLGRSKYLGDELEEHEESAVDAQGVHASLTEDDWAVLNLRRAFDLPGRAVCESLVATFVARCDPWMPVVEPRILQDLLHGRMADKPILLLQAVLMAGSRMRTESSLLEDASTKELYNRAKVLFFAGYEKDPMTLVTAVSVLQYWNPSGPSHISIHNSGYWLRIGVGLVHQMGLHKEPKPDDPCRGVKRRLFWTLFARDSLLSAGQGRPRAIHLEDCSIDWPSVSDFAMPTKKAHLWVAYVRIAGILGDLTQWHLRGCPGNDVKSQLFEEQIKAWIQSLPPELRVCDENGNMLPYDCDVRFLYLPYFTAISILYKPKLPSGSRGAQTPSQSTIGSTIAASCVARIFEDALARNEVRHGVAMQAIYLLIAGICQLGSYDYPILWRQSTQELSTITLSLMELSKTWQTAEDTLHLLQRLHQRVSSMRVNPNPPPLLMQGLDFELFKPFGPVFCGKLPLIVNNITENPTFRDPSSGEEPSSEKRAQDLDTMQYTGAVMSDPDGTQMQATEDGFGAVDPEFYDLSPQNIMSTLLEDLGMENGNYGENWFLQGLC